MVLSETLLCEYCLAYSWFHHQKVRLTIISLIIISSIVGSLGYNHGYIYKLIRHTNATNYYIILPISINCGATFNHALCVTVHLLVLFSLHTH